MKANTQTQVHIPWSYSNTRSSQSAHAHPQAPMLTITDTHAPSSIHTSLPTHSYCHNALTHPAAPHKHAPTHMLTQPHTQTHPLNVNSSGNWCRTSAAPRLWPRPPLPMPAHLGMESLLDAPSCGAGSHFLPSTRDWQTLSCQSGVSTCGIQARAQEFPRGV